MTNGFQQVVEYIQTYTGLSAGMLEKLSYTLVTVLVFLALRAVINMGIHRRIEEVSRRYVTKKVVSAVLNVLVILVIIRIWLGDMRGAAAYLGILSAGLAIALQDPLTNMAGWLFILIRKPFVVGDRIQIGDHAGDVIDVRLFQFSIIEIGNWVNADQSTGRIIHIPNGLVFKLSQANYNQGFNFLWNELPVTLTFESNWKKAKELLEEIARKHSVLASDHARKEVQKATRKYLIYFQHLTPIVWTSVADNGVTLTIRYLCEPRVRRSTSSAIWEDILSAFAQADDIDFAYPTTRFYDNVTEGKPEARASLSDSE